MKVFPCPQPQLCPWKDVWSWLEKLGQSRLWSLASPAVSAPASRPCQRPFIGLIYWPLVQHFGLGLCRRKDCPTCWWRIHLGGSLLTGVRCRGAGSEEAIVPENLYFHEV